MTLAVEASNRRRHGHRPVVGFIRHYLEMVVAMFLGMAIYPLWELAVHNGPSWTRLIEVESLVMATAMSIPMVAWMAWRGHRVRSTVEMVAAMFAGFVVLFPLLWAGVIGASGLMIGGHILMPTFMLAAMLVRRREYLHCSSVSRSRRSDPRWPN